MEDVGQVTFAFFNVIWATMYLESWKRRSAELAYQVWQLTQFFLFPFCENSLICLEGKSMTPHWGNTILFRSSQQLPRLRLGPSKGFLR